MPKRQIIQSIIRALLVALALVPAACGRGAPSGAAPTSGPPLVRATAMPVPTQAVAPTDTPAPPTAVPTTAATAAATATDASVLVVYHKSGGFAGVDETLTVYADGSIALQDRSGEARAQASPADIKALQALLASPELAAIQPTLPPAAADAFIYELTLPGRSQPLVAADSADIAPVLVQMIMLLEKLKAQVI